MLRRLPALALVTAALFAVASTAQAGCTKPTSYDLYVRLPQEYPVFKRALVKYFGTAWVQAASVSFQEGSWHTWASNGCYQGTFQMGCSERRTYGHGSDLTSQVIAAARYWRASGRDWSPWECKP